MSKQSALVGTTAAAKILGWSEAWVRHHDDLLEPLRMENGRRVYRRDHVEKVARERGRK